MTNPQKMTVPELRLLWNFISSAETSVFAVLAVVEGSEDDVEHELKIAIQHLSQSKDLVEQYEKRCRLDAESALNQQESRR